MTNEKTTGEKQSRGEVLTGDLRREWVECCDLSESASFYSVLRHPANSPNAAAPGTCCREGQRKQPTCKFPQVNPLREELRWLTLTPRSPVAVAEYC